MLHLCLQLTICADPVLSKVHKGILHYYRLPNGAYL